ncbi:MAG: anthranilate synthase component I family protein [Bacteroidales bacterium]|nr:anthranilate synthase component I family protein [Bacteroidales bacterium]
MYQKASFSIDNYCEFRKKALTWLKNHDIFCFLDSNSDSCIKHAHSYSSYDFMVAAGTNAQFFPGKKTSLKSFDKTLLGNQGWFFGFLTYDLKNYFEKLTSENTDNINWPGFYFFSPNIIFLVKDKNVDVLTAQNSLAGPQQVWEQYLSSLPLDYSKGTNKTEITPRITKDEYLSVVKQLKSHIRKGDLYEINFCQEFYAHSALEPFEAFLELTETSPAPFSAFLRLGEKFLVSASPERFLKKQGKKLISQPIKGTSRRGTNTEEDHNLAKALKESPKERSENIMIVDLVRNDLSRISEKKSVKIEELCGIYSFQQVHQMISTVSAQCKTASFEKIIQATFPMGSMTGAPKIKAMQLSEQFETTKRGLYSGSVGYIAPGNDFDFNVVIRSLQYNAKNEYLSYMVGGAITYLSDAEKEYIECIIKASAIEKLLCNGKAAL